MRGRPKIYTRKEAAESLLRSYRKYNAKPERKEYQKHFARTSTQVERRRSHRLRTRFGITLRQYNVLLKTQKGKCAICRKPEKTLYKRGDIVKTKPLSVDHCHRTQKVRGLLCFQCNVYLGFEELRLRKPAWLRRALRYLENNA
jgi:hypothetical protein